MERRSGGLRETVGFRGSPRSASVHVVLCGVGVGETVDANVVFRVCLVVCGFVGGRDRFPPSLADLVGV